MSYSAIGKEHPESIERSFEDYGAGTPVMLIHGFPLNGEAWEKRVAAAQDAQDTRPTP